MENSYPISLREKMIRETEEYLEAHLPHPQRGETAQELPDPVIGRIENAGEGRDDLHPAA